MSTIFKNGLFTSMILVIGALTVSFGQINLAADVINFRSSSGYTDKTTTHYGALSIIASSTSVYSGLDVSLTNTVGGVAAIKGTNNAAGTGYGGLFNGGYVAVKGNANVTGSGNRYGAYFYAAGGASNYGMYASGATNSGLFVGGPVLLNGVALTSDIRAKKDIAAYAGGLNAVMSLKPSTYEFDPASYPTLHLQPGKQIGFIAQDVKQILPDVVTNTALPDPENPSAKPDTIETINYIALIPVLVNAIQEQQKRIDALETALKAK
jgi:hypothetical protein